MVINNLRAIVSSPAKLTAYNNEGLLEITEFGSDNALEILLDQVDVSSVSDIVVYMADDVNGSNLEQIATFSLLGSDELTTSGLTPLFTLDRDIVSQGKFLQIKLIEGGQARMSSLSSVTDSKLSLDFGGGTKINIQTASSHSLTNVLLDGAKAIDLDDFGSGPIDVEFQVYREAAYDNTVGFYVVDDVDGSISIGGAIQNDARKDSLLSGGSGGNATVYRPGDEGYREAAMSRQLDTTLTGENGLVQTFSGQLQGGLIASFLIVDGDDINSDDIYFSYGAANAGSGDRVKQLGNNMFGFEDMTKLGDKDYNDIVVKFNVDSGLLD